MSNENPGRERMDAIMNIEGELIDRLLIDSALKKMQTVRLERVDERTLRQHFRMRLLINLKTGRLVAATTEQDELFQADELRAIVTVDGTLESRQDGKGRTVEETMQLADPAVAGTVSDDTRAYIKRLLEGWREMHNQYIAHP